VSGRLVRLGVEVVHRELGGATREFLIHHLASFDLFHYCGHGYTQGADGLGEVLRLADGPLRVADVLRARPRLLFAFVNACSAGQQKAAPYGELTGAANLLLASGVGAVLAPLVPVQDRLGFAVSEFVYDRLAEGMPLGEMFSRLIGHRARFDRWPDMIYRLHGLPELTPFGGPRSPSG
jgi:hypothetical protein